MVSGFQVSLISDSQMSAGYLNSAINIVKMVLNSLNQILTRTKI